MEGLGRGEAGGHLQALPQGSGLTGPLRGRGLPGPDGQGQRLGEPHLPSLQGGASRPTAPRGSKDDGGLAALQPLSGLAAHSRRGLTYGRGSVIYKTRCAAPGL